MAQKKKRNKSYAGKDAAQHKPQVVRVQAVSRSRPKQWYVDNQRIVKPLAKFIGITLIVVLVIVGIIELIIR